MADSGFCGIDAGHLDMVSRKLGAAPSAVVAGLYIFIFPRPRGERAAGHRAGGRAGDRKDRRDQDRSGALFPERRGDDGGDFSFRV